MAIPNLKKRIREMNGGRSLDQQAAGRTADDDRRESWTRGFYTALDDALRKRGVGGLRTREGKLGLVGYTDSGLENITTFDFLKEYSLPEHAKKLLGGDPRAAKRLVEKMRGIATGLTFDKFKDEIAPIGSREVVSSDGKTATKYDLTSPAYAAGTAPWDKYKTPEDVRKWVNGVKISDSAAAAVTDAVTDAIKDVVDADPTRYRAGDSQAYKDFKATIGGVDSSTQGVGAPSPNGTYSSQFLDKAKVLSAENQKVIDESKKKTADDAKWAQDAAEKLGVKVDLDMSNTGYKRKSLEEIRAEVDRQSEERRAKWRAEHPIPSTPQQTASGNVQQTASGSVQQTASGNVQQTASASNANQDVFNKDSTQAASKAGRSSRRAVLKTTHDLDYLLSEFPREDSLDDLLQED